MANQRVTLTFDADTSKAKASINELYSTLERLSSMNINNAPGKLLTKDIQEASLAATQLKHSLESAVNVNTGKLDLNKFNSSLQQSKMSLQDYQRILTSCGPAGQQAFTQLARSVITADASVIKLGDKVRALGTTLANTAKWQISSSIIHGITGAFSTAYNYAKDLNESLNNIRIVTGYSVDAMKDFAAEANKAAQALSTTTTEYSNAALIFYQQGLSGNAVKERVDTVIKLANVTGQSASEVSNYMTAIWNNFYDGSQSLEHYADVLTKLGAATASSSDEIAGGLEKFAAIGDTIGLSYEYAASALATITAQTRQSEEVVGTALKTIFARIQGLSLGETLEDGVDLNKYSSALKTVGIDIFDTTGELKNMDTILQEMGETWGTLSKAQQTALAQTVAGVRQYNQLISLMDNWDDFEINLDMAINADGSLEDQYAIYEESWEAASKRMKAATQDMYDSLINDEAFIKLTDFFTNLIQSISASIDSIGGLKGVLLLLGSVLMKVFSPQVGNFLDSIGLKIQNIATGTNKGLNNMKQQATQMLGESYSASGTFSGGVQAVAAENMGSVNQAYLAQAEKLGAFQKGIAESLLQQQNALNESVIKQGELVKSTEKEYEKRKATLSLSRESLQGGTKTSEGKVAYNKVSNKGADAVVKIAESAGIEGVEKTQTKGKKKGKVLSTDINVANEETAIKLQTAALEEYTTKMAQAQAIKETFITPMAGLENETANLEALASSLEKFGTSAELSKQDMEELNGIIQSSDFATIESELDKGIQSFDALEATLKKQGKTMEQTFGKAGANAIKQYAQQIKSAKSAQDTMRKSSEKIKELDEKIAKARTSAAKTKYEKERAEEQKKLTTATQQYNTAVQGSKTAMAGAGEAGKGLRAVFGEVDASMKQLNMDAATAKNALLTLGYSESQLQALEQACEDMNVDFAQLVTLLAAAKGGAQNFEGQLNRLAASSQTVGQTLSKIGSVASQVAMGINAISGLGEIWTDEDLTVGEKFTSTLMNLAMILPLVGTAIDAVNKLKNINKINSLAAAGATEVEIAAQMKQLGVTSAETIGLWGKAAAWIAAHPLLAGIGIAAAAIGIGIMIAMTAAEKKNTQAVEAAAEASEKAADASREKAEASQEELDAIKDLHDEYSELYDEYQDSGEVKSDLIEATTDLVNKLGIEEGHLLILQGRYEELNALIRENLKLKALENKNNADQAVTDAADSAHNTLEAGKNDKVFINDKASESGHEGQYVMGFWDVGSNDAWFTDYLTSNYPNGPWQIVGDKVVAYYTNPNQIPYLQGQFDSVFQGALDSVGGASNLTDAQKNGSIYNEYQRGIVNGGNEDSSKAWNNVQDAGENAYTADFEYDLYEKGVDDAASYGEARNAWIEEMVAQAEGDKEAAREYYTNLIDGWATGSTFASYANEYSAYEAQGQNIGANAGKYKTVDDIADQMEAEGYDRDLALQVKIEPWMTEEQINDAIHLAQQIADNNEITLTVTAAEEGIEALEDVVSASDYEAWWEKYGEQALKGTNYDKNTFAGLSPSEQKKILEDQTKLKPESTKQAEATAARGRATGNKQAYEDYLKNNSDYYNEDGTRKTIHTQSSYNTEENYYDGTPMFNSNSEYGGYIRQENVQLIGDAITGLTQQTTVTADTYAQVMADVMKLINDDKSEEAILAFDEKYGAGAYENLVDSGQMYALEEAAYWYHDNGYESTDADFRKTAGYWLQEGNALDWYNDVALDAETWGAGDAGAKLRAGAEDVWTEGDKLGIAASTSESEATRLEEEAKADANQDPYEKEMDYKEEISDLGLDVDEVYELKDALEDAAGTSEDFSKDLKGNEDALKEAAKQMSRYNKAVKDAEGKFDDWKDALKGNDLQKQASAVKELSGVYADMFDLDADDFSDGFLKSADNLDLMQKAMEGSEDAYNDLQARIAMDIIEQELGTLPGVTQDILNEITSQKIAAGDLIDMTTNPLGQQLWTMFQDAVTTAIAGGKSVAEALEIANALMNSVGFEPPEMEAKTVYITSELPPDQVPTQGQAFTSEDLTAMGVTWSTEPGEQYSYPITMLVPKSTNFTKSTENIGGAKSSGSGGGGGGSKKAEPTRKADVVERYKEVNDQLDDIQEAMDDANRAADKLWGAGRLAAMKKVAGQMETELGKLREKKKLAEETYLAEDLEDLNEATDDAGVARFTFDDKGNITNYDEIMNGLYEELDAAETEAGDEWSTSEQEKIDAIQERIDKVEEARKNYDETKEEIEDWQNEIEEALLAIQQQYFDIWAEGIEIDLAIDEADLAVIEYYLSKVEDDIYGIVETLTLTTQEAGIAAGNLSQFAEDKAELDRLHTEINPETGETYINDSQYIQGLQDLQSKIYENLGSINEATKMYQNAYSDALAAAAEELANYTDQMEHHNSVLEHYNNLLNLTGQSKDYEKMNNVLEAQVHTAENMASVSKSNYDMLAQKAAEKEAAWLALGKNPGDELTDEEQAIKNEWLAAQSAANEAQDKMLADAEAWAEALNALLENKLNNLADILDEKLSGEFGSLEQMNLAMERANSLQEEYLTTTNKVYETNKLMNTAQQEIDKTTNSVAKRKLKEYIAETEQLQNKNKLSKYELEIQQAKYDLLLAEIALEEAQDAKSTVRLQRDAEGNFGYVYTADQDAVADAEQKLADAQNALYNIGLEGANSYAEKYASTIQEMNDEITALTQAWQEGEITSEEEYQERMTALKEHYYAKLQDYSELYGIAITTDSAVVRDAWSTDFADMTSKTEEWMIYVDEYVSGVRTAFSDWATEMEQVTAYTIGQSLDDLATKTGTVKINSDALTTSITDPNNGVIKALEDELTAVDEVSQAYWEWYQNILSVIEAAEGLGETIAQIIEDEGTDDGDPDSTDPPDTDPPGPSGTTGDGKLTVGEKVTYTGGTYYETSAGGGKTGSRGAGKTVEVTEIKEGAAYPVHVKSSDSAYGWLKKEQLSGFDTGGYTGEWGPYGKLAMLHEKELVLNAHDTDNFLASIELMERILDTLDLHSMSAQLGGMLSSPGYIEPTNQVIEQHIEIEASFPAATDRIEIEEAFKSMANLASQYANRK